MLKISSGVLLAFVLVGCGSDPPPGATATIDKTLPDSPLSGLAKVSLIRAGDSFTLAGYDSTSGKVRWGRLALDGTLSQEASFAMAQPVIGPVFAATKKTSPGDQLVALAMVNSSTLSGGYDLTATVQTIGDVLPAAPIVLVTLPAVSDTTLLQLAAGAAASGNLGYVAWGVRMQGIPISYLMLPADAITAAAPSKMLDDSVPANVPAWDCLAPQSTPNGIVFSAVTPNTAFGTSDFRTAEIDENGVANFLTYQLTATVTSCHIVGSPTPTGSYFMAFQGTENGSSGIYFATYYPPAPPAVDGIVKTYSVLPSVLFGAPLNMPRPAWVTSAGGDVVIGLERKAGPQVFRWTYNAIGHGSALTMRSVNGNTGPVSAWVGFDASYVTYTDQVSSAGTTAIKRYFMRVDSPASLP